MNSIMKPSIEFIDLKKQYANNKQAINDRIQRVLEHGQYIMGPEVVELEKRLEEYTGTKKCIAVSSGTDALMISLMAIGIKPGDEVITTAFTFISTIEVIALLGAIPVLIDIDPDTCNINASLVEGAITSRTKAIIPVSLYGQTSDMDEINEVAGRHHGIYVIEDAAQSFGAVYKGRKSCNLSTIGCTSFFPSKPLGCYGDGGAIFTNNDDLAKIMQEIRIHGQERRYYHTRIGIAGRIDTLQCAVLLAKMDFFDWEVERRISVGKLYLNLLNEIPKIQTLMVKNDRSCVWAQFTIQVEPRDQVFQYLKNLEIPTSVHYPLPLHLQPAYKNIFRVNGVLVNSENSAKKVLSLPIHPYLDEDTQKFIINSVKKSLE